MGESEGTCDDDGVCVCVYDEVGRRGMVGGECFVDGIFCGGDGEYDIVVIFGFFDKASSYA